MNLKQTLPLAVVMSAHIRIPETLWHNPIVPVSAIYVVCIIPKSCHTHRPLVLLEGPMNNGAHDEQASLQ